MFGSTFSKALQVFGRPFMLAGYFPCLIVTLGLWLYVDPGGLLGLLPFLAKQDAGPGLARALFILFVPFLPAYIIFGLRDQLQYLLQSGDLWVFPAIRHWRRQRMLSRRDALFSAYHHSLAIPGAVLWANTGFQDLDPAMFLPLPSESEVTKRIRTWEAHLRALGKGTLKEHLSARQASHLAKALVTLQSLSMDRKGEWGKRLGQLRDLAKDDPKRLNAWYRQIAEAYGGDAYEAFQPLFVSPEPKFIRATRLGNALAFAESYSLKRYGIEWVFMLPRLGYVVDDVVRSRLEDDKTFLDFTIILTYLCVGAGIAIILTSPWHFLWTPASKWIGMVGWFLAAHVLYRVAVHAAKAYGTAVNSLIDLHRVDLLKALGLQTIPPLQGETEIWEQFNESFRDASVPVVNLVTGRCLPRKQEPPEFVGILRFNQGTSCLEGGRKIALCSEPFPFASATHYLKSFSFSDGEKIVIRGTIAKVGHEEVICMASVSYC